MACLDYIVQGYNIGCGFNAPGGLATIYLANSEDVTSITQSVPNGEYDTITMAVGKVWYQFDFKRDSANYMQTFDASTAQNTHKLTFALPSYKLETVNLFETLAFAKVYAIAVDREGKRFLLGYNSIGLETSTNETNSGSAKTDANTTVFNLEQVVPTAIKIFSSTTVIPIV